MKPGDLHKASVQALIADLIIPDGFIVNEHGLYASVSKKGDGDAKPVRVTSAPVGVTARARDHSGSRWAVRVEWYLPETGRQHLIVPDQLLHANPGEVEKELSKRGVAFNPKAASHLRSYWFEARVQTGVPVERTVGHLGYAVEMDSEWPVFVLPQEVILPPDDKLSEACRGTKIFFQPNNAVESLGGYRTKGTLEGWKQALAPWGEHSVIVFGVLLGFAGAFKEVLGEENHGFHLFGDTSTGKTTTLQVAASVMGSPLNPSRTSQRDGLFQTWNTTPNAVEMLLAPHSGMTVVLDEVGANDAGINLYNAFSGIAKARMTELGGLRDQNTWSVVVLSTGEHSVRKHVMATSPGLVTDGANVRMLDIPIRSMIELAEEFGAEPLPPVEELGPKMAALQESLAQNFGWALPAAVRAVYEQCDALGKSLPVALHEEVDRQFEFLKEGAIMRGHDLKGPHLRGLKRLALVAAVGAAVSELLPFTEDQIFRAVDVARDAWLREVEFITAEDKLLQTLRSYVINFFHHARVEDHRANPPVGGWPYFYFEKQQLIVFTKEQLQKACGGGSVRTMTDLLRRHKLLKGQEKGHKDAKLQAFMYDVVAPGKTPEQQKEVRAYHLYAQPILGDVLSPAHLPETDPENGHVDEEGVIYEQVPGDDYDLGSQWPPLTEEELIATMPRDWDDDEEGLPENRATAQMPQRRQRPVPPSASHGQESVLPIPGAEPGFLGTPNQNG